MIERTFVMIKPDGVQRQIVGDVLSRFEKAGLKIIGMKMRWVDGDFAKEHYKAHVEKAFYPALEAMITEGPVIAFVLEGVSAIETVRKIVGPTEPKGAPAGTIRGDYAHVSYSYADNKKVAVKNVIHASGDKKDADAEINLWFTKEELHSYVTVHEKHTL